MKGWELIKINEIKEPDGTLYVLETGNPIPFDIKRVFLVTDVKSGKSRGDHATKETRLILFPVKGSCIVVVDNGKGVIEEYVMDNPRIGLLIEPMIWRSMKHFSSDCVLMAVCNLPFNSGNETIDDYDLFIREVHK